MIETDVRNVKKGNLGLTALKKPEANVESLCVRCSINQDCKINKKARLLAKEKAVIKIVECKDYVWPIVFRDTTGTDAKFNTFRMGKAWSERLKIGDRVGLIDKENQLYGIAIVENVHLFAKEKALVEHGSKNHLMLEEDEANAPKVLAKVLRNSYGGLVYGNNDLISVIYFTREV